LELPKRLVDHPSPLWASQWATVQDEEILSLSTEDGGEAWLWGPSSAADRSVKCEVDVLSAQLVAVLFDYAADGPSTIAVWESSEDDREPSAVILVGVRDVFERPQSWPEPKRCGDSDALLAELRGLVAQS
jgi:hypothetical protein